MLKTILAVALFSIGAQAQQNLNLSKLQSIKMQQEIVMAQREEVAQDRKIVEAADQALSESAKDVGTKESGLLFGRIVTAGGAIVYGVPVVGRLYLDAKALYRGVIQPEEFMRALSMKQVVLGLGSFAAIFAVDQLNNLYVIVEKEKWPEAHARLEQKRRDLVLKERVLRRTETELQRKIQELGQ